MAKPTGRSFFFSQGSDVTRVYACPERACGISVAGPGSEPESAFLKPEIGRIGRACACARDLSALELERQVSLVRGGSGHSFRLLLLSEAAGSSSSFLFSLSLSSPPLFPGRAKEDLFSLARIHARTSPVHAARATLVCGMHMYAAFYEFKCEQRGPGGRASAISLVAPPSFLVDPRWIFSRKRRFFLEQKFSFITVGLILLLSFFCNWNCSY